MPIDPAFRKKRKKVGKEKDVIIWGPMDPPRTLGIRGTYVAVDWDLCDGCGICLETCPKQLYDWVETPDHPISEKKALPAREKDCVQCYKCENQCPAKAIRVTFGGPQSFLDQVTMPLMLAQIIGGVVYGILFGPYLGLEIPLYVGLAVLAIGVPFFVSPALYFPKKGKPQQGKNLMDTTVVVENGTYGVVRHPQLLGCILLIAASILISQHWLAVIIGVPISAWFYAEIPKDEKGLIIKFGDDYKHYMQRVPRINFLLGIIRLLRHRNRK